MQKKQTLFLALVYLLTIFDIKYMYPAYFSKEMRLIQLYHLFVDQSFHSNSFWTSSALITSDKAVRGFRESTSLHSVWERLTLLFPMEGGRGDLKADV